MHERPPPGVTSAAVTPAPMAAALCSSADTRRVIFTLFIGEPFFDSLAGPSGSRSVIGYWAAREQTKTAVVTHQGEPMAPEGDR
jgi:hypothetical protein